jgi:ubiquinone/menaquinone biosynthesis C-methylase UbiE
MVWNANRAHQYAVDTQSSHHASLRMHSGDAAAFIKDAVLGHDGVWADLGAGTGTFTRALLELLGDESRIYALDRDASAVADLTRWAESEAPTVTAVQGDFTEEFVLPGLGDSQLDGILLANSLHFAKDSAAILTRLVKMLRPGGRVVLVEYDRRAASRWVPYPISIAQLPALAAAAGLSRPRVVESRPSEYGGILYAATMERLP